MSNKKLCTPIFAPGDLVKRRTCLIGALWVDKIHGNPAELLFAVNMPTTPGIILDIEERSKWSTFIKYVILIDNDRFIVQENYLETAT